MTERELIQSKMPLEDLLKEAKSYYDEAIKHSCSCSVTDRECKYCLLIYKGEMTLKMLVERVSYNLYEGTF